MWCRGRDSDRDVVTPWCHGGSSAGFVVSGWSDCLSLKLILYVNPGAGWLFQEVCRWPGIKTSKLCLRMWVFLPDNIPNTVVRSGQFFLACFCYLMVVQETCGGTASYTAQDWRGETRDSPEEMS